MITKGKVLISLDEKITNQFINKIKGELSSENITEEELCLLKIIGEKENPSSLDIKEELKTNDLKLKISLSQIRDIFLKLELITETKESIGLFRNHKVSHYSLSHKGFLLYFLLIGEEYKEKKIDGKSEEEIAKEKADKDDLLRKFLYKYSFTAGDVDYLFDKFKREEIINEIKIVVEQLCEKNSEPDLEKISSIIMKRFKKRQFDKDFIEIKNIFAES